MSIVDIQKGYTGVEASGNKNTKKTTEVFTVVTDDPADSAVSFTFPLSAGGVTIPAPNTPHPEKTSYLSGVPTVTKRGPTYFEIKVPYETPDLSGGPYATSYEDPLAMPVELNWDDATRSVPYDRDLDGNPVVNTMGEPFDPSLTREVSDPVLLVERNEASFGLGTKITYDDTVNAEAFYGVAAGRARMGRIKARQVHASSVYYHVRYEIAFRMNTPAGVTDEKAWFRSVLNQGFKYKDATGVVQTVQDGSPVLLAADGTITDPSDPHWLYFREYKSVSWAGLGL